jgi:2-isopropylmalate synthase
MSRYLEIYDTTLRDGAQMKGIALSLEDKLNIARILIDLGVGFIEAGWPGANKTDTELFDRLYKMNVKNSTVTAFGMTRRKDKRADKDGNLRRLYLAKTPIVTLVGKTWKLHVRNVLETTPSENLRIIEESCRFFVARSRIVFYDAEHFFDAYQAHPFYAIETLRSALRGGAARLILCDTNGGTLPDKVGEIIIEVRKTIKAQFGIHAHNDSELAVANSLSAISAGAVQVQGTFNGYGERTGNANLCSLIPNLQLKMGINCLPAQQLSRLTEVSRHIAEIVNLGQNPSQPYVGENAFAHKAGMHAAAMRKCRRSYQQIEPSLVGNKSEVLVSELSGRGNVLAKAEEFGLALNKKQLASALKKVKAMEAEGFRFEGADGSLELLMRRIKHGRKKPFEVLTFNVTVGNVVKELASEAVLRVKVGRKSIKEVAEGNGPVHAIDACLRKVLSGFYPVINAVRLADYKVRILGGRAGASATVRVLAEFQEGEKFWSTSGTSANIIEASLFALVQGLELAILRTG